MLPFEHPLIRNRYHLVTPDIRRLAAAIQDIVAASLTGLWSIAVTRTGKTWAIRYLCGALPVLLDQPCVCLSVRWEKPDEGQRVRVIDFYQRLLGAIDAPMAGREREKLLKRYTQRVYALCAQANAYNVFLFVDEAQNATALDYHWFVDVYNELSEMGLNLYLISMGQPDLEQVYTGFSEREESQIIGRFFLRHEHLRGICSAVELRELLEQYDSELHYPDDASISYTQAALPNAYEAGWRLANHDERIFASYRSQRRDRNLDDTVGMSMRAVHSVVKLMFTVLGSRDQAELTFDDETLIDIMATVVTDHV